MAKFEGRYLEHIGSSGLCEWIETLTLELENAL